MGKKDIIFTKAFTSPIYGNVWEGRACQLSAAQANSLIENGLAKLANDKAPVEDKETKVLTSSQEVKSKGAVKSENVRKGKKK